MLLGAVLLALVGCKVDSTASRLFIEASDDEREWACGAGDPRSPGEFNMPISYKVIQASKEWYIGKDDPTTLKVGDILEITIYIDYGRTTPATKFLSVEFVRGNFEVLGEEGVDFFPFSEEWEEDPVFVEYAPPDYLFPIQSNNTVSMRLRALTPHVMEEPSWIIIDNKWATAYEGVWDLDFRTTLVEPNRSTWSNTNVLTFDDLNILRTILYRPYSRYQCHPSQWDRLTDDFLATLVYKPTDENVTPKRRFYNVSWNLILAATRKDRDNAEFYKELRDELEPEIDPKYGNSTVYQLELVAYYAFPDDYIPFTLAKEIVGISVAAYLLK